MKRLLEKLGDDLRGVAWLTCSIFIGVALSTYAPGDPSFNAIVRLTGRPQNACGYLGSFLADLLYQGFGVCAWVVVAACLRQSYVCFTSSKKERVHWGLDLVVLTCITCLLTLHFGEIRVFGGRVRPGGLIGYALTRGMVSLINEIGLSILLWAVLAALGAFYSGRTWSELIRRPRATLTEFYNLARQSLSRLFERTLARVVELVRSKSLIPLSVSRRKSAANFFEIAPQIGARIREDFVATPDVVPAEIPPSDEELDQALPEIAVGAVDPVQPKKTYMRIPRRVANWALPKLSLLQDPPNSRTRLDEREIKNKARLLVEKLAQFSVRGELAGIKPGPAVTMFEFKPAPDVKISKITDLADDLSLALSSESVRIIAPIPGRDVVGIETSNSQRESVYAKDIIAQEQFWTDEMRLPIALGRRADGEPRIVDLRKMPHLLVAGTTGSGKSVFIVSMITGLLFRHSPKTLKLILVDPKQVDLAAFNEIPHLVMPPIREAKKAVGALRWAIKEMDKRYRSMSRFGARGLEAFNEMAETLTNEARTEHAQINDALEGRYHPESYYYQTLPYIVIVVEEFGDLMVVDKINVEQAVVRLAQMARACGIHLVLAMQSPRKDVVTGLIKTNIPGRISFKVASKMDSRIILDEGGAERLLARGDMLFLAPGVAKPERHHGPFLSEDEISAVVDSWKRQGEPEYDPLAMKAIEGSGGGFDLDGGGGGNSGDESSDYEDGDIKDERYDEVIAWVAAQKEVSASLLQRKYRLGYPRAARMIEIFEREGVVGPANGSKPRTVLVREMPR